jgi:hypothetical protein
MEMPSQYHSHFLVVPNRTEDKTAARNPVSRPNRFPNIVASPEVEKHIINKKIIYREKNTRTD